MAREKTYRITGTFEGMRVNTISTGFTKKQAKFRAGFDLGLRGNDAIEFKDARSVKVRLA